MTDDVQVHHVADLVKRRWWIILGCALLMAGLAWGATGAMTPHYTATSTVLLRPLTGNALDGDSATNSTQVTIAMETEAGLVTSPEVAALVSQQLGHSIPAGSTQVSAMVPANTETVRITFTAASPVAAREGAEAFASNFLQSRTDRAQHANQSQLTAVEKQSKEAQIGLKNASEAAKSKDRGTAAAADARVQLYASRISSLEERASQLTATGSDPGFVVTPARTPTGADGLSPWLLIAVAGVFGMGLGGVVAVWRERSSDVIRAGFEDSICDVPVLSVLPSQPPDGPRLLTRLGSNDPVKNAYRMARVGALARMGARSVIAVSDLSGTQRAGDVCSNLALALSDGGRGVTVVDATLDEHVTTKLLNLHGNSGLTDVLETDHEESLPLEEVRGIRVLPSGTTPSQQVRDRYGSSRFVSVMDRLRSESDLVLVSAPPAVSAEGNAIGLASDGVILVGTDGHTTHAEVRDVVTRSAWLGIHVIGIICESPQQRGVRFLYRHRADSPSSKHTPAPVTPPETAARTEQSVAAHQ